MRDEHALIWDLPGDHAPGGGRVLYWRSLTESDLARSIPRYVEQHADRLRSTYLAFIHDLGESHVGNRPIREHLRLDDGFSLWWMTELAEKSPFKSPRIYDCIRLLALELMLKAEPVAGVRLATADEALAEAVAGLARSLGLEFRRTPDRARSITLHAAFQALPSPLQGLAGFARHLFQRWPLRARGQTRWQGGDDAIFFCSYLVHVDRDQCEAGKFATRMWGPLPALLDEADRPSNWLHHFMFSAAVPDTRTGQRWLERFNAAPGSRGRHEFLDAYLDITVALRAVRRWLWLNIVAWRLRGARAAFSPAGSSASLWPLLRRDWAGSLTGVVAARNCLWLELFDRAMADLPRQERGFYIWENQGWETAMLRAWRKHGHGRMIGVQHATVPFWHLNHFSDVRTHELGEGSARPTPDLLAANGPQALGSLASTGFPRRKLLELEALRYLHLGRTHVPARRPSDSSSARVLVLGDIQAEATHGLLRKLMEAANMLSPTFEFTLKPHPASRIDASIYPGLRLGVTTDGLDRILAQYDMVLAANSTSAAVEAYLSGLGVIVALDGETLNLSPLRGQPGVSFVCDGMQLAVALQGVIGVQDAAAEKLFNLDAGLPRWRSLLAAGERGTNLPTRT